MCFEGTLHILERELFKTLKKKFSMCFDLAAFLRQNFRAFFKTRGEQYRLTPKRFLFLILWLLIYIVAEVINRIFFLLDEIFFPRYHHQEVRKPVFIIGNPRSGTTMLHRLMSKDEETFTAFKVWELVLAPSITQRKIVFGLAAIGRWVGHPLMPLVGWINKVFRAGKVDRVHAIRVDAVEEDEHIMIHNWTSETLFNLYPYLDEVLPYFYFDRDIPDKKKKRVMKFYKNMLQRHLYAHGGDKVLLSKNPSHSSRIAALSETFPDARFIKLVRNPFEAVPSMLNTMSIGINIFCSPLEQYPFTDEFIDLMKYYYFYPVEFFKDKEELCSFIRYDDLVEQPDLIIEDLYAWLGLSYSESFKSLVADETHAQHFYRSKHEYPLEKIGLTEEQIFREFEDVYSYYEFDRQDFELQEREMLWQSRKWSKVWKRQRVKRMRKVRARSVEYGTSIS